MPTPATPTPYASNRVQVTVQTGYTVTEDKGGALTANAATATPKVHRSDKAWLVKAGIVA